MSALQEQKARKQKVVDSERTQLQKTVNVD